jgi:four helix bundle protein
MDTTEERSTRKINTYKDLVVWQKAHQLVMTVYKLSLDLPQDEQYALAQQIKAAALDVATNIVKGYKRYGKQEKLNILNTAQSSLENLKYLLLLITELGYADTSEEEMDADEVSRILNGFLKSIREKQQ